MKARFAIAEIELNGEGKGSATTEPEPQPEPSPKKRRKAAVRPAGEKGALRDLAVEFLKKNGPSRVIDIIEGTGIPKGSATGILKDPRIVKVSRGVFQLAGARPVATQPHDPFGDEEEDEDDDPPEIIESTSVPAPKLTADMISDSLGTGKAIDDRPVQHPEG